MTEAGTAETGQLAREALIRLEPRFGGAAPAEAALRSWAGESAAVVAGMLQDPAGRGNGQALLARADELLGRQPRRRPGRRLGPAARPG